ncbi:MAG TPA: glycosyltransferase family 4 protein [Candidatus Paceibacterota bacterium]|nr:glycosyltransferase family 4 protein [Candidatus Paceibacterota bacterium]
MKIAITHFNLATESGDTRLLYTKARTLAAIGHSVDIYTVLFDKACFPELHKGLNIIVVPLSHGASDHIPHADGAWRMVVQRIKYLRFSAKAAKAIKRELKNGYDIVDFQDDSSYHIASSYKKDNPNARLIWTMNTCPYYRTRKKSFFINIFSIVASLWERMKVGWYVRGIDFVIVNGDEQKESIEETVSPKKVVLMRLPVDFDAFFCNIRKAHDPVVLLTIGSLSSARRFEDVIIAAAKLRDDGYESRTNIICKDFSKNKTYKDSLLRLAKENDMESFVKFYFEGASEDELKRIQRESDIFIFPNTTRIWSMIAFESMAAGLALVASDATNVVEVLEDKVNAVFSKSGDPSSIAEKIEYLLDNPEIYERISRNGQEFVRENLAWDKYAEKIFNLKK